MPFPILVRITDRTGRVISGPGRLYGQSDVIIGYAFKHRMKRIPDTDDFENVAICHTPVSFLKEVDKTTPRLNQILTTGEDLKEVEFSFLKPMAKMKAKNIFPLPLNRPVS